MKYGFFDDAAREYVITTPMPPLPWINYLGQEAMFGIVSQTGGGYDFYRDAKLRRLTRYRYNNIPADRDGRVFYLKEGEKIWSPAFRPVNVKLDSFRCRHGLGYTIIESGKDGISCTLRFFVPLGENVEVREVVLKNNSDRSRKLSLFAFTEFCLYDAAEDDRNFQRNFSCGEVELEPATIYHKTEYRERRDHYTYVHASETPTSFDSDRDSFLGAYGDLGMPLAVKNGCCSGSVASGWAPCAAQQFELELAPGEEKKIVLLLGYVELPRDKKFSAPGVIEKAPAEAQIARLGAPDKVEAAFAKLRARFDELLSVLTLRSPDEKFNRMLNVWHPYQCLVTFNLSRSASLFESGVGRGMGFRDSNQDLLGFVHLIPERARERLLDLAATQKEDGGAYHQYQPLTKRGNSDIGGNFNDDPLWLVLAACAYCRETGDFSILEERVPYENDEKLATPLLEHLFRSIEHTVNKRGPHGLPLIGRADWNDCLNLNCFSSEPGESFQTYGSGEGRIAESLMIAGLFVKAANEFAELLDELKKPAEAAAARRSAEEMTAAVNASGRDPEWFLRAYDANGHKVGSTENGDGKIYIESQGWCAMAGIGRGDGFAAKALDSVEKYLGCEHGIMLQYPPYKEYHLELGEVSSYPPGYKENGAVFCHTNPWIIIAETMLGKRERAFDHYTRIAPAYREDRSDVHRCEPYVYSQMIAGTAAPRCGEAKNSWLTGTAAWNYLAAREYLLGVRATYGGLVVDPQLPSKLLPLEVTRKFRGATYRIKVAQGAEDSLRVNGEAQAYASPVAPRAGAVIEVEVTVK